MKIENNNFNKLYRISYEKTNNLIERINLADKAINDVLIKEEEKNNHPTSPGEIRKYIRKDGKIGIYLILQKTSAYEPNVLICPLYIIKKKKDFISGYKIGVIPQISCDFEFLAAINEIRFEKKIKLGLNDKFIEPICYLLRIHLIEIIYIYRSLLEHVIKLPCKLKKTCVA